MDKKKAFSNVIGFLIVLSLMAGIIGYLSLAVSNDHTIIKSPTGLSSISGVNNNASSLLNASASSGIYGISSDNFFIVMLLVIPVSLVIGVIAVFWLRGVNV